MVQAARILLFLAAVAVARAAEDFRAEFVVETTEGQQSFTVRVHPDWAPLGVDRFKELVEVCDAECVMLARHAEFWSCLPACRCSPAKFYDDTRFYRVLPKFVVQFGLSGDPETNALWRSKPIKDDPVTATNKPGTITFAKTSAPNSRTTQLFINTQNNARLDGMGFAPFGEIEGSGMDVVAKLYNCGEKPNQGEIQSRGNAAARDERLSCKVVRWPAVCYSVMRDSTG
eukprot:6201328-Pleurochrysis_carterae.AAC.1